MADTAENKNTSSIESMFAAGAHFGYSKSRRHPSFKHIIFGSKNNVDIVNLEKTSAYLAQALAFVKKSAQEGKHFIFVATKPEARRIVEERAVSLDIPYVSNRWIGGTLTNFPQIKKRIALLHDLQGKREKGELSMYTKKERLMLDRKIDDLLKNFGGIMMMERLPDVLFVVDPKKEKMAVVEAIKMKVPVVALLGSDCDLEGITYPIPANDSSRASITFFVDQIAKAYTDGKKEPLPAKEAVATTATETKK